MHIRATEIGLRLQRVLEKRGLTQKALEMNTGVNQSQISRILRGEFTRLSPNVLKLCKYAKIPIVGVRTPMNGKGHISKLVEAIVDGSPHRERLLVKLLRMGVALTGRASASIRRSSK